MPKRGTGRRYPGVMVSSSFADLAQHREAMRAAIDANGMKAEMMEQDSARADVDVIDSSLQKVRSSEAYVGLIGHRYGQTPVCPVRNPDGLSLTQLELNLARSLDKPILLFVMGDDHLLKSGDVEVDPAKREKLVAFKADARRMTDDGGVERVYATFESYEDFRVQATQAAAKLGRFLEKPDGRPAQPVATIDRNVPVAAPDLWAVPRYAGSHQFVGRAAELDQLDDWASEADPHPVLLFEAIGGTGKSMLTWHWLNERAPTVRSDWSGRFWYSFYERGADMADFLRCALAYTTGRSEQDIVELNLADLTDAVIGQLEAHPWLFVLDGLERILVAYHRHDAAQLLDEEVGTSDEIANRDVRAAISVQDDELLRRLTTADPSKLLLTTRITPSSMLNSAGLAIPGVRRQPLSGLRPADAEALLRMCGVDGSTHVIQRFLQEHCDCHPLVTGALAGLVRDYLPQRGNFDAWAADPRHGGQLDLAEVDLVQKRNHILRAAIKGLDSTSRDLLSSIAMIASACDYALLQAIDPKGGRETEHDALTGAVCDLEERGLLQFDHTAQTYDLHPVVRSIAFRQLRADQVDRLGQRVVDYFSSAHHDPFEDAVRLDDLAVGINLVQTNLKMSRFEDALTALAGPLAMALNRRLPGASVILSLIRPFFPEGWTGPCRARGRLRHLDLLDMASIALRTIHADIERTEVDLKIIDLAIALPGPWLCGALRRAYMGLHDQHRFAEAWRILELLELVETSGQVGPDPVSHALAFELTYTLGQVEEAQEIWDDLVDPTLSSMPGLNRNDLDRTYARFRLEQGHVDLDLIDATLRRAEEEHSRFGQRSALGLQAEAHAIEGRWPEAETSLVRLIAMLREDGAPTGWQETLLVLARAKQGSSTSARDHLEKIERHDPRSSYWLARVAAELGDRSVAVGHARRAHRAAWADGEPYVFRYELERARALLEELGEPIPELPPYDPAEHLPYPWEATIRERYGS